MSLSFQEASRRRDIYAGLYIGGAILLIIAATLWWTKVSVQPERVFWNMLSQSLRTTGVTLDMEESYDNTTAKQTIQYSAGSENVVHAQTTLKQGDTTVKTESLGNSDVTYTRYLSIDPGKSAGKSPDLKSIEGVWAKSDDESNQLFSQIVLGTGLPLGAVPVPMANLQDEQRTALLKQMKDRSVYQIDYSSVKKQTKNGTLLYTYDVEMQPILYLTVMKTYAKYIGLTTLENLDPNEYANLGAIKLALTVDAHAGQLVSVEGKTASFKETYTAYGIPAKISIPKQTISTEELQKKFSDIQAKQ